MPIHDRNILSAPHTNVKTPPSGVGNYDPKERAAYLKALANIGPKGNKEKNEGLEGAIDSVYAVQKPYSGCQLTSLVQPIDPLVGLGGSEITSDNIHAMYPDQKTAQRVAETLYKEFQVQEQALEEKKVHVIERIKKTMDALEKQRKESVDMIKENPKEADHHKQKVAHIATQIDDLVDKLKKIEMSKKQIEKNDKKKDAKKDEKKKVEEALVRALKEKKEDEANKPGDKPKKLDRDTTIYINKSELKGKTRAEYAKHKLERQGYKVDSSEYDPSKQHVKIKSYGKLTYHPIKVTGDKDEKKPIRTIYK